MSTPTHASQIRASSKAEVTIKKTVTPLEAMRAEWNRALFACVVAAYAALLGAPPRLLRRSPRGRRRGRAGCARQDAPVARGRFLATARARRAQPPTRRAGGARAPGGSTRCSRASTSRTRRRSAYTCQHHRRGTCWHTPVNTTDTNTAANFINFLSTLQS